MVRRWEADRPGGVRMGGCGVWERHSWSSGSRTASTGRRGRLRCPVRRGHNVERRVRVGRRAWIGQRCDRWVRRGPVTVVRCLGPEKARWFGKAVAAADRSVLGSDKVGRRGGDVAAGPEKVRPLGERLSGRSGATVRILAVSVGSKQVVGGLVVLQVVEALSLSYLGEKMMIRGKDLVLFAPTWY